MRNFILILDVVSNILPTLLLGVSNWAEWVRRLQFQILVFLTSHTAAVCRVLRVNYALPMKIKGGDKGFSHQAVWADADR